MTRPYGKQPRTSSGARKTPPKTASFKIELRGKDDSYLSMEELQQGFYEAIKELLHHRNLRAKRADIYIPLVDENGQPVAMIDGKNVKTIFPYVSVDGL